jgi:hypothetical protein
MAVSLSSAWLRRLRGERVECGLTMIHLLESGQANAAPAQ